jgi:YD repeat-containing protein
MVAVVNGSGLGLFTTLGSSGSAALGQGRERIYVNSTSGNLVIQGVDEILTATGSDLAITRTYNSLGLVSGVAVDGDNNDGWRIGVLRSIFLDGSQTAPTRIVKTFGDGAQVVYSLVNGVYRSTEGDGAHDSFQLVSGQWIWTDGSSRETEFYDLAGKIVEARDADGNRFSYGYTGSLITTITVVSPNADAGNPGQGGDGLTTTISLEYLNPTTTKQLQRIRVSRSGTADQTLTSYGYDAQGRLQTVTVDLTPENTGDSVTYITTYAYEGTSNRVGSITQRAGGSSNDTARVSFTYVELDGGFRLKTYTDGEGHITTFNYSQVNGGGGSSTTLPANSGVLSTTETQNVPDNYALNPGAVSTTDTQNVTNQYNVNNSQITTGATQTDTYNRNNGVLSTTDTQTTTDTYNVNNAQITPAGTQTDTYDRIDSALSTTKTTVTNQSSNLNTGALIPSSGGTWSVAALLEAEPAGSTASAPQVAFDSNGDGFAIWAVTTSSTSVLKAARYTRSTDSWAAPTTLYSGATGTAAQASLSVDAAGNALVAWLTGGALSAKRYTSGAWGTTATVVSSGATLAPKASINGSFAAIIWGEGSAAGRSAYVSRWNGSAWTTKTTVDNQTQPVGELQIAVDNQGNVVLAWSQNEGGATDPCVWTNRYRASNNSWSGAGTRDILYGAAGSPQIAVDGNGDAFMVFGQEGKTFVVRYERATDTWGGADVLEDRGGDVLQTSLSMDAAGNAVFAWIQNDPGHNNAYACLYNAATSTWGPSTVTLESLSTGVVAGSLKTSMSGGKVTAVWLQNDGTRDNAYAATYNGIAWSAAALLETSTNTPTAPAVYIDPLGNASALWIQSNGTSPSVYMSRFTAGGGGQPYYTVPAGATWQSVANALYGTGSAAAAAALEAALGFPALNVGAHLAGFPDPLTYTETTTITVPPYYTVPAGASWQSIASTIYGINSAAAGAALQSAMGNPALTTGVELTNFPATISLTQSVAAHYLVTSGASWQSIANVLYGVNNEEAGAALQTALGNPSVAAGSRLFNIPATLSVTTTATVTVPPYYTIPAGASWQSIANAIYGVNSAAAGSALQTAMGNPALTAGNRLTNLPATIAIVTNLAPHYLVPAGATWQSIANTLYGVNNAAAGAALQTALANPALTAGARLYNIPATLSVTTTSTITVPAYYVIPSSPSWQAIANALYGINSAAAGSALQTALGNPALTPGNRLTNLPATLTVVTQQTVTVPPYYIVPAGATWASITQAVYGTSVAAAVAALQAATGSPALTTGLHLTVPANLTYSTATAINASRQPTYVVSQETNTVQHDDQLTAPLDTTEEVTTPTDFDVIPSRFATTEVRPNERTYNLTGASTTINDTRTFPLTGSLTYPPKGWGVVAPQTVSGSTANVSAPKIAFDGSGNGVAVWITTTGASPNITASLRWARYDGVTKTWGAVQSQIIATASSSLVNRGTISNISLAMDSVTGRAVLCWAQGIPTGPASNGSAQTAGTVYASIFNPATGQWASPSSIGSAIRDFYPTASMRNGIAAVSYATGTIPMDNSGAGNDTAGYRAFVARFNGSSWTQAENRTASFSNQVGTTRSIVGVDSSGNIHLAFTQGQVGNGQTVYQRWNGSSWSASQSFASWGAPDGVTTYGAFGANGDGIIAVNASLYRYAAATGTWTTLSVTGGGTNYIAVDESGRAVVAYLTGTNLSALTFDGSAWSAPVFMSSTAGFNSVSVAMRNGRAVVTWNQSTTTYARTFEGGAWAASAQNIGTSTGGSRPASVGIDSTADMHVLWAAGTSSSSFTLTGNRFISAVNAPGYITLDGSPTWQEIAAQMYGQNFASAGDALRVAMGNPT